ncbi:MAG TPA: CocE/NonD family hydrolase, partial [Chitinophagaceae bacterium]
MRKIILLLILVSISIARLAAQTDTISEYKLTTAMIPMRDGIKLFTSILTPVNAKHPVPILLQRTPYSATMRPNFNPLNVAYLSGMAKEGYIFVMQDIRGKYKSEGTMQIHQPLIHATEKNAVDESTDTWDTIDWLVKNTENNNGKAGIFGISYPGWLAL